MRIIKLDILKSNAPGRRQAARDMAEEIAAVLRVENSDDIAEWLFESQYDGDEDIYTLAIEWGER